MRPRAWLRWVTVAALVMVAAVAARPCAMDQFYGLTGLRGQVVGASLGPLNYLPWLRRSFVRANAKLTLYEFRLPMKLTDPQHAVKSTTSDAQGNFDVGPLAEGRYTLVVDDAGLNRSEWFQVEIRQMPKQTGSVLLDVSPHPADCSSGHEVIVRD